jgi:hypothetical protein
VGRLLNSRMMLSKHFKMALPTATVSKFPTTGWSFTADVRIADQKREFLKQKGEPR